MSDRHIFRQMGRNLQRVLLKVPYIEYNHKYIIQFFKAIFKHDRKIFKKNLLYVGIDDLMNCLAHFSSFWARRTWTSDNMVEILRKCFSSLLIRGMGNLLYTISFSATTINLKLENKNQLNWSLLSSRNFKHKEKLLCTWMSCELCIWLCEFPIPGQHISHLQSTHNTEKGVYSYYPWHWVII